MNNIAFKSSETTVFDSKDAKCIVCADISSVQRPGKTWKNLSGALLDNEWNQSCTNAVTPTTHLFLEKSLQETQRVCTGKGMVLINLSYFERSSSFLSLNEFFKLIIHVDMDHIFKNRQTGTLKQEIVFLVDNGPAESPSSVLIQMLQTGTLKQEIVFLMDNGPAEPRSSVLIQMLQTGTLKQEIVFLVDNGPAESRSSVLIQMLQTGTLKQEIVFLVDNGPAEPRSSVLIQLLLMRLRKLLKLKSVTQVSFSEYHSKRN